MSRVIKFRAWDVRNSQMVYEPFLFQKRPDYLDNPEPFVYYGDDRDYEDGIARLCYVMQFTGLHDKNGKEIYEGDIVKVTNKGIYNGLKVVVWDDILLCYVLVWADSFNKWKDSQSGTTFLKVSSGIKCEIIGNIYENPELLQEKGGEG